MPLQLPEWHLTSELRHNVFLAFKEALHNAVKHSRASEVLIRLEVKEKWFELTVKDNRQGFAFGEKMKNSPVIHGRAAAGNGLENVERRLAAIGGNCEIQSTPGPEPGGCFSCNSRLRHSGNRDDTEGIQGRQARGSAASMI